MPLDVLSLQSFYASPLGRVTHRLIGRVIRERWDRGAGLCVAAVGYGAPYLERFRDSARRCLAWTYSNNDAAARRNIETVVDNADLAAGKGTLERPQNDFGRHAIVRIPENVNHGVQLPTGAAGTR